MLHTVLIETLRRSAIMSTSDWIGSADLGKAAGVRGASSDAHSDGPRHCSLPPVEHDLQCKLP